MAANPILLTGIFVVEISNGLQSAGGVVFEEHAWLSD